MNKFQVYTAVVVFLGLILPASTTYAQPGLEPPVRGIDEYRTPSDYNLRSGAAFNIVLNNFGFGISGEYRRVLTPLSEGFVELQITALRDVTEQNYQFFGQQIIPNKRNRVLSFPLTFGFKHRLFPQPVSDNFRLFVSAQGGPTLAFVYPYYSLNNVRYIMAEDFDPNTFSDDDVSFGPIEANTGQFVNDAFQGWGDGSWMWGTAGQLGIGVDFGDDFKSMTTVKVGFTFSYFSDGIQVMDPFNAVGVIPPTQNSAEIYVIEPGTPKQKFFGSPFITISFGSMW